MVLGFFLGGAHFLWAILVAIGWGQVLLNFIFWLHMLSNPYQVAAFDFTAALLLVVVTFGVGYVVGWIFASLWNKVHK
jgi:NADH:ubiquinone oxidoreductase subunit 6 (subunit J)